VLRNATYRGELPTARKPVGLAILIRSFRLGEERFAVFPRHFQGMLLVLASAPKTMLHIGLKPNGDSPLALDMKKPNGDSPLALDMKNAVSSGFRQNTASEEGVCPRFV